MDPNMDMGGSFFSPGPFMPHGGCYLWTQSLIALHAFSDGAIVLSYYAIPFILLYFVKQRKDLKFKWVYLLFAAFVLACGTTHLMEIWNIWHANYWLSGFFKAVTALVSVFTTVVLVKLIPQALALPSAEDLRVAYDQLEIRVRERTAELEKTTRNLQAEITARMEAETILRRTDRALRTISDCNQMLVRAKAESELLQDICRVIVEQGGYRMACVGFSQNDAQKSIRIDAHVGFDEGYLEQLRATWADTERGRGPIGTALRSGQVTVCNDTQTDPNFAPWRATAAQHGFACLIALPLQDAEKTFGVLTIYAAEPNAFNPTEIGLLKELAGDLAYGIQALRIRAEHEQAVAALHASESRLQFMLTATPAIIYSLRPGGDFATTFVSANVREVLGYEAEAFNHDPLFWLANLHPDDASAAAACFAKLPATNAISREYRFRHRDGRYRWMHDEMRVVRDAQGEPAEFVGYWFDITEHRRAEEELRASELLLRSIMENSKDVIFVKDRECRFVYMNPAGYRLSGMTPDKLIGRSKADFHPNPAEAAQFMVDDRRVMESSKVETIEEEIGGADGKKHVFLTTKVARCDGEGNVIGMIGVAHDITKRKRAEQEIQRQAAFARFNPNPVMELSATGEIKYFNAAALQMAGALGEKHPAGILPPNTAAIVGDCLATARPLLRLETQAGQRIISWSFFPVEFNQSVHCYAGDITERKRAERALRESEALYQTLVMQLPIGVFRKDVQGRFVFVNPEFCQLKGMKAEDFLGKTPLEVLAAESAKPDSTGRASKYAAVGADHHRQIMLTGQPIQLDEEYSLPTGEKQFVQVMKFPVLDPDGKIVGTQGVQFNITERKRAEEQMNLQASALTAAANAIVITSRNGKIEWVNPAFTTLTGYAPAEAIGSTPRVMKSGEHPPSFYANMWATITTGNVWHGELTNKRKDGRLYTEDMTITPVCGADGQIAHFVAIKQDVTNRKQMELLMGFVAQEGWSGAKEDYFARLVEYLGRTLAVDYVFIGRLKDAQTLQTTGLYAKGRIVPDMEYSMRGTPCENVIGKTPCHYDDKLQELFPDDRLLVEMGVHSYLGVPLMDSTGQPLGLLAMLDTKPMPDSQQAATMLQIAAVRAAGEIERQARADELRWKTTFLEALITSSQDGILVVDNQGKKVFQNQRVADLWKLPPEIARQPEDRLQHDFAMEQTRDPEGFSEKSQRLLVSPDRFAHDEIELKDGSVLERQTYLAKDHNGKSYGRVWIFRDITNGRQMEARLRQAQKMEAIGTLAGGIAHDFNNILAAIFGYSNLLQQDTEGNSAAQDDIVEILKAAGRAKDLVQQILTFSRQREQKRQVIRLDTVVKEATKFLRASLPAQIKIEMDLAENAPAVLADPTQIYQVTMNLATNALHAMEGRPGLLTVKLEAFLPDEKFIQSHPEFHPVQYARLTVADTGHGMDAITLGRIFEPFFTTKPIGKGTGLGLAVVHGLVQSHEGAITVESRPGHGTTFCLYFPAQASSAAVAEAAVITLPPGRREKILLVDDEPALTATFQRLLTRLNYQVISCNSARDAIALFRESPARFDLVITDLTMPEINGLELARELRAQRPDVPVILASGFTADLNLENLHAAGVCELLEKPIAMTALAEALQRTFARRKSVEPGTPF